MSSKAKSISWDSPFNLSFSLSFSLGQAAAWDGGGDAAGEAQEDEHPECLAEHREKI